MEGISKRLDLETEDEMKVNLFWSSEDECWIAEFPEYSINTFGNSPSDALRGLGTVLELYMDSCENHPIQDTLNNRG